MSSTVNMDMVLISTSNILPSNLLRAVFEESVKELGGTIQNGNLFLGKENLGKLTLNSRIVLSFSTDFDNSKRGQVRKLLRDTFTRRVSTAHENYLYQLKKEKEQLSVENVKMKNIIESANSKTSQSGVASYNNIDLLKRISNLEKTVYGKDE